MSLQSIAKKIMDCTLCDLHKGRTNAVPGEGPPDAKMMIIGEAPGQKEDLSGRPFVGRSGGILNVALDKAGFNRSDFFITSVVKCRPPNNRTPTQREQMMCLRTHGYRQTQVIDPHIICLCGGVATGAFLGKGRLADNHGKIIKKEGRLFFPTYHPAAAGRNPAWHRTLIRDMRHLFTTLSKFNS